MNVTLQSAAASSCELRLLRALALVWWWSGEEVLFCFVILWWSEWKNIIFLLCRVKAFLDFFLPTFPTSNCAIRLLILGFIGKSYQLMSLSISHIVYCQCLNLVLPIRYFRLCRCLQMRNMQRRIRLRSGSPETQIFARFIEWS